MKLKNAIIENRGFMSSRMDEPIKTTEEKGSTKFIYLVVNYKMFGIRKAAEIAESLTLEEQDKFAVWCLEKKPNKNQIDTYLLRF